MEDALARIEAALRQREAENARLRKIEIAAAAALTELDGLLGDRTDQRKYG